MTAPTLPSPTQILEATTAAFGAPAVDGSHAIDVTLIRPGTSKNGITYSPEVLTAAAPLFEGARAFVDHADNPSRSVRDLVGSYSAVRADAAGIHATLTLVPGEDWLWNRIRAAADTPDLFGLSIDALGNVEESQSGRHVTQLVAVNSVDLVSRPAAGGAINRILHSAEGADMTTASATPAAPAENPELAAGLAALREEMNAQLATVQETAQRELAVARAEAILHQALREAQLPEVVEKKLLKRFAGTAFEPQQLTEAIDDERDTLASLAAAPAVTGHGAEKPPISVGMSELDRVQAAFDGLFDLHESEAARAVPRLSGIREAFLVATGVDIARANAADRPLREELGTALRAAAGRLQEGVQPLQEADVTTATFSFLLGTSMNKRLLKDYQAWPSEWQKFTTVTAIKDFKQQDRIRLGSFGSLSTVAEDAAYTTLTLSDTRAIYTPTKRGNLVQVTRETIVNDDLYAIRQIPQKLAVSAAFTLAEFVYNLLAPNFGNIYDAHPLFDSVNHLNSAVIAANLNAANLNAANSGGALTSANLQTAIIKMRKQTNMAAKPIGLKPRFLLVPPDLEFTAMTILKSAGLPGGNNNDINPVMGYAEPIVAPQLNALTAGPASTTIWIAVADPRVVDTLEVGFIGGQQNPVLLIQDMPLYGLNFTQDVITYKVRHEYGGAVVDYRGFYLGNN
jgi:phage major head subunit gpT-like protein